MISKRRRKQPYQCYRIDIRLNFRRGISVVTLIKKINICKIKFLRHTLPTLTTFQQII